MRCLLIASFLFCLAAGPATKPVARPSGPEVSFALVETGEQWAYFVRPGGKRFLVVQDKIVDDEWMYVGRTFDEKGKQWIGWVLNRRTKQSVGMEEHKELQRPAPHPKRKHAIPATEELR